MYFQVSCSLGWSDLLKVWPASWALHDKPLPQPHAAPTCRAKSPIQNNMQGPASWSHLKQIQPTQTVWDLKRHTSCLPFISNYRSWDIWKGALCNLINYHSKSYPTLTLMMSKLYGVTQNSNQQKQIAFVNKYRFNL